MKSVATTVGRSGSQSVKWHQGKVNEWVSQALRVSPVLTKKDHPWGMLVYELSMLEKVS